MKILNSINQRKFLSFVLILSVIAIQDTNAQRKKRKKKNTKASQVVAPKPKPKKKEKSIADLTKSSKKIEGLFTIFQDTVSGSVKLLVKKDQLNKDFIYFAQIADGVTEAGHFRGSYQGSAVFHVKQYFDRLEFVSPNTAFYFDKNNG